MYSLFFFVFINYSDLFYDPVKLLPVNTVHISQCPALSYHSKSAFLCLYCSSLYLFITKKRAKKTFQILEIILDIGRFSLITQLRRIIRLTFRTYFNHYKNKAL